MSGVVGVIYDNPGMGPLVQAVQGHGARLTAPDGRSVDVRYDESRDAFVVEYSNGVNFRVFTGSNKVWIEKS